MYMDKGPLEVNLHLTRAMSTADRSVAQLETEPEVLGFLVFEVEVRRVKGGEHLRRQSGFRIRVGGWLLVEFKRISLTGFRSCTSRSRYRSVSKQTTREIFDDLIALDSIFAHLLIGNTEARADATFSISTNSGMRKPIEIVDLREMKQKSLRDSDG
ncbi:hypothetical protein Tco_1003232 [Tanacetum coccineum]|uniref:Uncharacterized protein n=1 Tax=Tanacetum coccineum TaxID=301880 RepID=A0ABQ5F935_9ASTR